ncbi:NAD-dependent epimerase/dehydratase family protein [Pseudomonas sp. Hz4]
MNKVVLVGGGGFIGQHVARFLLNDGNKVVMLSRHINVDSVAIDPSIDVHYGDYGDREFLRGVLAGANAVVHLAHDSLQLNQICDMAAEYQRNIAPAIQLMEECLVAGIDKFVFVSSGGTVYGDPAFSKPLKEDAAPLPISLYGTSKLCIEHMVHLYSKQRGLPGIIVRPANAYGPGQIPFKGQGLVATAFASAMQGKSITIFGDGGAVRDYVHVDDIAYAITSLLDDGQVGEVYNIGSGVGTSVLELVQKHILPIVKQSGFDLQLERKDARAIDVAYNVLDVKKLSRCINFSPITLSVGLPGSWDWVQNHLSRN